MTWVAHFDNTNWTPANGSWSGTKWLIGDYDNIELAPAGTWAEGYRPLKIRVTFEGGGSVSMSLQDGQGPPNEIASNAVYGSTGEETCTFYGPSSGYDITKYTHTGAGANITNIEFDEEDTGEIEGPITDNLDLDDEAVAGFERTESPEDGAGLGDEAAAYVEQSAEVSDGVGVGDGAEAFNWSEWLNTYASRAVRRYFFTLTGEGDGVSDAEIPISSWNARHRSGESSYLSVVIPGMDYSATITARANGDMVLEMAYVVAGQEALREELMRVAFETIRTDEGGESESITLTGHRTETYEPKVVDLQEVFYRMEYDGELHLRCPPDLYLRPGDTCRHGSDEFTAGMISYVVNDVQEWMEVQEG